MTWTPVEFEIVVQIWRIHPVYTLQSTDFPNSLCSPSCASLGLLSETSSCLGNADYQSSSIHVLSLLYYMPSAQIWNVHSALLVQLLTDVKAQFFPVHTGVQRIHLKWVRIFIGLSFQGIFRVQWLDCYSAVDNYKYTLLFGECRNDSLEWLRK